MLGNATDIQSLNLTTARAQLVPATKSELADSAYDYHQYNLRFDSREKAFSQVSAEEYRRVSDMSADSDAEMTDLMQRAQKNWGMPSEYLDGKLAQGHSEAMYVAYRDKYKDREDVETLSFEAMQDSALEVARQSKTQFELDQSFNIAESPRLTTFYQHAGSGITDPAIMASIALSAPLALPAGFVAAAGVEAVVSGAAEIPIQMAVYGWQKDLGHEYTVKTAAYYGILGTLIPAAFSGVLGAGFKALGATDTALFRGVDYDINQIRVIGEAREKAFKLIVKEADKIRRQGANFDPSATVTTTHITTGFDVGRQIDESVNPTISFGGFAPDASIYDYASIIPDWDDVAKAGLENVGDTLRIESINPINIGAEISASGMRVNIPEPLDMTLEGVMGSPAYVEAMLYRLNMPEMNEAHRENFMMALRQMMAGEPYKPIKIEVPNTLNLSPTAFTLVGEHEVLKIAAEFMNTGEPIFSASGRFTTQFTDHAIGIINARYSKVLEDIAGLNNGYKMVVPPASPRPKTSARVLANIKTVLMGKKGKLLETDAKLADDLETAVHANTVSKERLDIIVSNATAGEKAAKKLLDAAEKAEDAGIMAGVKIEDHLTAIGKIQDELEKLAAETLTEAIQKSINARIKRTADHMVKVDELNKAIKKAEADHRALPERQKAHEQASISAASAVAARTRVNKFKGDPDVIIAKLNANKVKIDELDKNLRSTETELNAHIGAEILDIPRTKIIAGNKAVDMLSEMKGGKLPKELEPVLAAIKAGAKRNYIRLSGAKDASIALKIPEHIKIGRSGQEWWKSTVESVEAANAYKIADPTYNKVIETNFEELDEALEIPTMGGEMTTVAGMKAEIAAGEDIIQSMTVCALGNAGT